MTIERRRILIVTGLSGAGKSTILRVLEDLNHEVIDNPPLGLLEQVVLRSDRSIAIGIDVRTRGFETNAVIEAVANLRARLHTQVELLFATAEIDVLLRRFTATRRQHPLAQNKQLNPDLEHAIRAEMKSLSALRAHADLVIDTSDLPTPELRQLIAFRFGDHNDDNRLTITLMSFAYPAGLPREADLVFDARFLKNPHYEERLAPLTGLDMQVRQYIKQDPDYAPFIDKIIDLLALLLPRFLQEGKKHVTIAVGCSGGQHRSVTLIEEIAHYLCRQSDREKIPYTPIVVMHRELARQGKSTWRWARPPARQRDSKP